MDEVRMACPSAQNGTGTQSRPLGACPVVVSGSQSPLERFEFRVLPRHSLELPDLPIPVFKFSANSDCGTSRF